MKTTSLTGVLLTLVVFSSPALAQPKLSIFWTDCSTLATNRNRADGSTATVVVTASGFTEAVRGVQIKVHVRHFGYAGLPLAWQFDNAGCQSGKFQALSEAGGAGCPLLAVPSASVSSFQNDGIGGTATYSAAFSPVTVGPASAFTVAKFAFDFSNAACACTDQSQCLIVEGSWLDQATVEHAFGIERESLSWEDPTGGICGVFDCEHDCYVPNPCAEAPTPVQAGSWGSLKAAYR